MALCTNLILKYLILEGNEYVDNSDHSTYGYFIKFTEEFRKEL